MNQERTRVTEAEYLEIKNYRELLAPFVPAETPGLSALPYLLGCSRGRFPKGDDGIGPSTFAYPSGIPTLSVGAAFHSCFGENGLMH